MGGRKVCAFVVVVFDSEDNARSPTLCAILTDIIDICEGKDRAAVEYSAIKSNMSIVPPRGV
jgi:hypothetical protein